MPRLPPVTRATLPESSLMPASFLRLVCLGGGSEVLRARGRPRARTLGASVLRRLVGKDHDAGAERRGLDELERCLCALAEQELAAASQDGVDGEPEFVDQA